MVILASAALERGVASQSSPDNDSTNQQQLSRVAVFELRDDTDRGDEELSLDKAGEWLVEGPTAGVGFCADDNGMWSRSLRWKEGANECPDMLKVFHIDTSNHLIVQRIVLVPAAIQPGSGSPEGRSSVGLANLNPFKTGSAPSQGHPAPLDDRIEGCRILLEDFLDAGELKLNQRLRGIQLRSTRECVRGAVWSDSELYVRQQPILKVGL